MNWRVLITLFCWFTLAVLSGLPAQAPVQAGAKRARHPRWDTRSRGVFFPDVFQDVFHGRDPFQQIEPVRTRTHVAPPTSQADRFSWAAIISAEVLEDEIKSVKTQLERAVASPGRFQAGGYQRAQQQLAMAATWFGIVAEYDGEIRWRTMAKRARNLLAKTAANATSAAPSTLAECKERCFDVQVLVGGGTLPEGPSEDLSWDQVVGRGPLMKRLQTALEERTSPWLVTPDAQQRNAAGIAHEAQVIAAIGVILTLPDMPERDDDEYRRFCDELQGAAMALKTAIGNRDADRAIQANRELSRSCSDCHDSFRG